jgi:hypothetical protein
MLRFMRKYATGYLIKALFGVIILVFVFWGVGRIREGETVVAEVGPYKVSMTEYRDTYNRMRNMYRTLLKDKFDEQALNIKERAMNDLVDKHLMSIMARRLGMAVSDAEFLAYIHGIDAFKQDGKFSQTLYKEILKREGMDPKEFKKQQQMALLSTKVMNLIRDNGVFLDDKGVWSAYVKEKGKVNLFYVEIDPSLFKLRVTVDDAEADGLYEKEKGTHKGEDIYRLKYLVIDSTSGIKDDAAYLDLLKIKDMDRYAREKGLEVVDLGPMREGELYKRFQSLKIGEWLKDLRKNDIALPVRIDFRSYIFQLVDREAGKPIEKSIVVREIRERLIGEKARVMARAWAEEAVTKGVVDGRKETGFIDRSSPVIPKLGPVPKDSQGVLALSKENPIYKKPVEIGGKYYVFSFKDEMLPDTEEWKKERESFRRYLVDKSGEEVFRAVLDEAKKREKVKINWEGV